MKLRDAIKQIPFVSNIARGILNYCRNQVFVGSDRYWEGRYRRGGTSGSGSYNHLAVFKAEVINTFVKENNIQTVIEFGCGDGNQLKLMNYSQYYGLDVSSQAIQLCKMAFKKDKSKSFYLYHSLAFQDNARVFRAQLVLSLDVIYHLIETSIYEAYMAHIFDASEKYVIIYSSNRESSQSNHVKHHKFTDWVAKYRAEWQVIQKIDNKYPFNPKDANNTTLADFYIFEKRYG